MMTDEHERSHATLVGEAPARGPVHTLVRAAGG